MPPERITYLLERYFSRNYSESEMTEMAQLINKTSDAELQASLQLIWSQYAAHTDITEQESDRILSEILASKPLTADLHSKDIISADDSSAPGVHRVHFLKTVWFRYAAVVIIIFGIGAYLWNIQQKEIPSVTQVSPVPVQNDVAPGGNRATLTLADGSKIILDSAANGKLAEQGTSAIEKKGGQIVYSTLSSAVSHLPSAVAYNTMSTPRGGQYKLTLPDGSQVWLNAESSITYPATFGQRERARRVSVTGEVYFEVAKNKAKPFIVSISPAGGGVREPNSGGLEIEVLGTHFNVNAYQEEPAINTTLLEGAVRLTNAMHTSFILKPGQQGQLSDRGLSLAVNPDLEQVMAWKNGFFNFNKADLPMVLRQLERWYDITVKYEGPVKKRVFRGELRRDLTLMQITRILRQMDVNFRLENKTLFVQ